MNSVSNKKSIRILGLVIIFMIFPLGSCVYDKEFAYINDQLVALNNRVTRVARVQESVDPRIEEKLSSINGNQAEMTVELDRLKKDIQELEGRVEDNEHIIKRTVENGMSEQDAVREKMTKLADLIPQIEEKIEDLNKKVKQQQQYLGIESSGSGGEKQGEMQTVPAQAPTAVDQKSDESRIYDLALSLFREEKHEQALEGFKRFLAEYPKSDLADNAQFWIGECLMALKQYEQAILAYQDVIKKYPNENKVPNAMLRQAIAFIEINDKTSSKLLLKKVIKQFPNSSEAKIAQAKLKTIK